MSTASAAPRTFADIPAHERGRTEGRDRPASVRSLPDALRLFFSHASPRLLGGKALLFLLVRPLLGPFGWGDVFLIVGVGLYWPFQEWFLHTKVLHRKPTPLGPLELDTYFARRHREHHQRPWDIETSFLPLRVLVPLIPANIALFTLATPTLGLAATGITAMTAASLLYEWTHFLTHTGYKPKSALYRKIRRNHRMHHFRNEQYWHGFTVPYVDELFGTGPDPRDVPQSESCYSLGVDPRP